jgi:hypothetical protein
VYTFLKEDGPRAGEINKVLRIWTIKDNKLYTPAYLSEADRYSEHLPEIEKTIDSYRINSVTTPASARSIDSNNDNKNNERNNDNNQKNWRDDPNCWYYEYFVCDESGKCDGENFDCVTDCDDGSSVTTGFPCPGEKDEGVPDGSDGSGGDADSRRPPSDNPYCDLIDQSRMAPGQGCFDRKDYDQSTGLYPCRDGSDVEDWRDCPDGPEANSDPNEETGENVDGDNEIECQEDDEFCEPGCEDPDLVCGYEDEETSNCGGEPCTATEKEDSWTDEVEDEDDDEDEDETEGDEDVGEDVGDEDNLYG